MIKRLLVLTILGVMLSGCFMVPMAFIGPAASGFTTASILQSGVTTGASFIVKRTTGKTIAEHAFDKILNAENTFDKIIGSETIKQSYLPIQAGNNTIIIMVSKLKKLRIVYFRKETGQNVRSEIGVT